MASQARAQVNIDIPRKRAWAILKDFSCAHKYVPGIVRTEITSDQREGVGASRVVYNRWGRPMDETITDWDDEHGFRIRLHKGEKDAPFRDSYFIYQLEDGPANTTNLTTIMGYALPRGRFWAFLDSMFLNRIITGVISDVALSMKCFYETGKPTSKHDLRRLKKQVRANVSDT